MEDSIEADVFFEYLTSALVYPALTSVFLLLSYVFILSSVNVQLGKPPINKLLIAYKYAYLGRPMYDSIFNRLQRSFADCKAIKICYGGPKASYIEFAYGIILNEDKTFYNIQMKEYLQRNMFTIFPTPEISHALTVVFPIVSWLRITQWIAIAIGYMKICSFSQEHNLCGYPVIEIYSQEEVCVIVPLIQQDDFVVWEAQRIVHGYKHSAMLRPVSVIHKTLPTPAKPPTKVVGKLKTKKKKG